MKIVYGIVEDDGKIMSGSDNFSVEKYDELGKYKIRFNPDFKDKPAITAIAEHAEENPRKVLNMIIKKENDQGDRKKNFTLLIQKPDENDGAEGSGNDNRFHFIAIADE